MTLLDTSPTSNPRIWDRIGTALAQKLVFWQTPQGTIPNARLARDAGVNQWPAVPTAPDIRRQQHPYL
ncbi:hypothetical protein [Shimia sagamensis]|uniref:Uncharacterized protein n=1 Tax=Shimia sagamensis TaxID=1566352 RepID=A0ABY1P9C7_9RHOB|nr:hypothetical protein [Shimia sagamensis]SMP27082.1 hypothetical protein SAMN06265373_105363 [Shimia sagamensis]